MAWNPTPEVAVARDAAKRLGAFGCVVIYIVPATDERPNGALGMASFGQTMKLCAEMGKLGDRLIEVTKEYFAD